MKYQLVGKSIPEVGKTMWEIVGNLKNFGVGRLVITWAALQKSEPSFYRILKVQPLPPEENKFYNRNVIVWVDEIYKGRKIGNVPLDKLNYVPQFSLIPKLEEEKYWKLAEEYAKKDIIPITPRYIICPPLFREIRKSKHLGNSKDLTKLNLILKENAYNRVKFSDTDEVRPNPSSDLHKLDVPVEEAIREIVRLQKIVNAHSAKS